MAGTDTAHSIVRALTVSRLVSGALLLPLAWAFRWWAFAAIVFLCAFLTDMVDGALARHWQVTTEAGRRLDSNADSFLTLGGMVAVTIAGVWSWWVVFVVLGAYAIAVWLEKNKLRGDALGLLVLAVPLVNFAIITSLAATLWWLGMRFPVATFLQLSVPFWAVLGVLKRHRVLDYLRYAIRQSQLPDAK